MTLDRATPQEHLEYWLNWLDSASTSKEKDVALRRLAKREARYWAKQVRRTGEATLASQVG